MTVRVGIGDVFVRVRMAGSCADLLCRQLVGAQSAAGCAETGPRATEGRRSGEVDLALETAPDLPVLPPSAPLLVEEGRLEVRRAEPGYLLRSPNAAVEADPAARTVRVVLREAACSGMLPEEDLRLVLLGAGLVLQPLGLYPLRATALALEEADVLLALPRGRAPSRPLSAAGGTAFLRPEAVFLHPVAPYVEAMPLRREAAATARSCRPRLLVFPELAGFRRSRLEPLRRSEALLRLAGQSGLLVLATPGARAHLDVLRRLTAQATACRLVVGRDLLANPDLGTELLRAAITRPQALD